MSGTTAVIDQETSSAEGEPQRLDLKVVMKSIGPCRKHVQVTIPRSDIDRVETEALVELQDSVAVRGFRPGKIPAELLRRRFKKELSAQVRQTLLVQSLEQLSKDNTLDPINEPDFDVASIEVPEQGDFEYEFDVEVRPEFDLPKYQGLSFKRPTRAVSPSDIDDYLARFREQYSMSEPSSEPAVAGGVLTADVAFSHHGETLRKLDEVELFLKPTLRLQDGEIANFAEGLAGVRPGDVRKLTAVVSSESPQVELRGESVDVEVTVRDVRTRQLPTLDHEFCSRIGFDTPDDLRDEVRRVLERQIQFEQRQSIRKQVLGMITASATWDLPEAIVRKQAENALRREVLEMQQAGYTVDQIRARENTIRQNALSETQQALKEHFILDRIATQEKIDVEPHEIEAEIQQMALSRGESPRRVRARLEKGGMIDNLFAQVRERKAVDFIVKHANITEEPMAAERAPDVATLPFTIAGAGAVAVSRTDEDDVAE